MAFNKEMIKAIVLIGLYLYLSISSNIKTPSRGKNVSMVRIQISNMISPKDKVNQDERGSKNQREGIVAKISGLGFPYNHAR